MEESHPTNVEGENLEIAKYMKSQRLTVLGLPACTEQVRF